MAHCGPCRGWFNRLLDDDSPTVATATTTAPAANSPATRRSSIYYDTEEQRLATMLGLAPSEAQDIVIIAEQVPNTPPARALEAYRQHGSDLTSTILALFDAETSATEADSMAEELPFFVYGTLMRGLGNHDKLLQLAAAPAAARLVSAHHLRHFAAGHPGLYAGAADDASEGKRGEEEAVVHGELATAADFGATLRACDALEEYYAPGDARNLFERIEVLVLLEDEAEPVRAWAYRCMLEQAESIAVPGGCWRAFVMSTGARVASDDWCTPLLGRKAGAAPGFTQPSGSGKTPPGHTASTWQRPPAEVCKKTPSGHTEFTWGGSS